jgi:hypothetical protein
MQPMAKTAPIVALIFLFLISIGAKANAFEISTHEVINEFIAKNMLNGFSLDTYLKDNLGIESGIDKQFNSKEIFQWLRLGGAYEDSPPWTPPYLRSVNHFHNPLTDGGFTGIWGSGVLVGRSSIQWALAPQQTQHPGGYYSWSDVREYYFNALTDATLSARDTYFAQTFRGLGQLMHLVQDASVPAHSRDDGHYIFSEYEGWVADSGGYLIPSLTPVFFSGQINSIASFIDTNQYNNPSPNPALTMNDTIGAAEYSNANFFSDGTILNGTFPYPAWSGLEEYDADVAPGKKRTYLRKIGDGQHIEHAAAGMWFYKALPNGSKYLGLKLDQTVYSDYATLLIPRAVGYSAGLLNYFFRGKLGYTSQTGNAIKIINESGEGMQGTFSLYYDNKDGFRQQVVYLDKPQWENLALPAGGISEPLAFQIPPDASNVGEYMLVFQGGLGAEQEAVVGRQVHLPPPYAFIVQEKASFGIPVVTEYSEDYPPTFLAAVKIFSAHDQTLSGHFETSGQIQSISLLPAHPIFGVTYSPTLIINDQALPGLTWTVGDTVDSPLTWKVTNLGDQSQGYIMRVLVSDGVNSGTFDQLLLSYPNLIEPLAPSNVFPFMEVDEQYAVIQYQTITANQNVDAYQNAHLEIDKQNVLNLLGVDSYGLGSNLHLSKGGWNVLQIDGTPPADLPCPYPDGGNDGGCRILGFTNTHPASVPVTPATAACSITGFPGTDTEVKGAGLMIIGQSGWPGLVYVHDKTCAVTVNQDLLPSSNYSVPLEAYLSFSISAEIVRTYSDDDLAYFHSIGIDPPVYSVIFE